MVSSAELASIQQFITGAQPRLETVRRGAVEAVRPAGDVARIEAARAALAELRTLALAPGLAPVAEVAAIVEEALGIVVAVDAATAPTLGHYVAAAAADLTRVVHAVSLGQDPGPGVEHARSMLRAMPRDETSPLVQIDLSDRERLARLLESATDGPAQAAPQATIDEIRRVLDDSAAAADGLLAAPGDAAALDELISAVRALHAAAMAAPVAPIRELVSAVARVAEAHRTQAVPLSPDAVEFVVACHRVIRLVLNAVDDPRGLTPAVDALLEQSTSLLAQVRHAGDMRPSFWSGQPSSSELPRLARESPDEHAEPPRTVLEAVRLLIPPQGRASDPDAPPADSHHRDHGTRDLIEGVTGPDGAIGARAADLVALLPELTEVILALEREPQASAAVERLRGVVRAVYARAAVAGARAIVERGRRIDTLLSGGSAGSVIVLGEAHGLADELEWLAAELAGPTEAGGADIVIPVPGVRDLTATAGELAVRGGGHEQRSRRLAQSVSDIAGALDRLRGVSEALARGGAAVARGGIDEIAADLELITGDLERLRRDLDNVAERQAGVLARLDHSLAGLRHVPLARIVPRLERVALGAARQSAKRVRFTVEGEDVPIDAATSERTCSVLLELVRNAVERGIESPARRRAAGKPEQGTIVVRAGRDGRQVTLDVVDDGAGFDLVVSTGRRGDGAYGSSELETVTLAVAELGGSVTIDASPGQGTTVRLQVPLPDATVEATVVAVSGARYAFPYARLEVVDPQTAGAAVEDGGAYVARVGSERSPVLDLGALLGLRSARHVLDRGGRLLRVRSETGTLLLRVDGVFERERIVPEPPGGPLPDCPAAVGTALLPSGQRAVILDLAQLVDAAGAPPARRGRHTATLTGVRFVLLADPSSSVRRNLGRAFEQAGWRVLEARDALDARRLLASAAPDLLVASVEPSYLEVVAAAQRQAAVPVIGLLPRDNLGAPTEAGTLGVTARVLRPVDPQAVVQVAREVLDS